MGYTTDFTGDFTISPPLSAADKSFLDKLANTRRMKRNVGPEYGVEGEFYLEDDGTGVIDHNSPPKTQPGLWLQWVPTDDGTALEWDGSEKFYNYIEWLQYLIDNIFIPRGYTLNGEVKWFGEERSDVGTIVVTDNKIQIK